MAAPCPKRRKARVRRGGFTLVELLVVLAIIVAGLCISLPRLMPILVYSDLEAAARHLGGYGRAATEYSALEQENVTVHIDLDQGVYWATRFVDGDEEELSEAKFGTLSDSLEDEAGEELDFMQDLDEEALADLDEDALEKRGRKLRERFERFARLQILAQARHVDQDAILEDLGGVFSDDFEATLDTEDSDEVEIKTDLLMRTRLPDGVLFDSVVIGNRKRGSGEHAIEVTPLGVGQWVTFYLTNENGDYFTIRWDPISGDSRVYVGRVTGDAGDDA